MLLIIPHLIVLIVFNGFGGEFIPVDKMNQLSSLLPEMIKFYCNKKITLMLYI